MGDQLVHFQPTHFYEMGAAIARAILTLPSVDGALLPEISRRRSHAWHAGDAISDSSSDENANEVDLGKLFAARKRSKRPKRKRKGLPKRDSKRSLVEDEARVEQLDEPRRRSAPARVFPMSQTQPDRFFTRTPDDGLSESGSDHETFKNYRPKGRVLARKKKKKSASLGREEKEALARELSAFSLPIPGPERPLAPARRSLRVPVHSPATLGARATVSAPAVAEKGRLRATSLPFCRPQQASPTLRARKMHVQPRQLLLSSGRLVLA